jgi:hypothetical protein
MKLTTQKPHITLVSVRQLERTKPGCIMPLHTPYRTELPPSDFHLFKELKEAIHDKRYKDYDVIDDVRRITAKRAGQNWYWQGILALFLVGVRL